MIFGRAMREVPNVVFSWKKKRECVIRASQSLLLSVSIASSFHAIVIDEDGLIQGKIYVTAIYFLTIVTKPN